MSENEQIVKATRTTRTKLSRSQTLQNCRAMSALSLCAEQQLRKAWGKYGRTAAGAAIRGRGDLGLEEKKVGEGDMVWKEA